MYVNMCVCVCARVHAYIYVLGCACLHVHLCVFQLVCLHSCIFIKVNCENKNQVQSTMKIKIKYNQICTEPGRNSVEKIP